MHSTAFFLHKAIHTDGPGEHELRITMRDRRIVATLDGDVIVDHLETDTRVPVSGTVHLLGDLTPSDFRVQPVATPPVGSREPRPVSQTR